jgi:uncharacterized membrane protein
MRHQSAQKKSGVSFRQTHVLEKATPERLGAFSDAVFAVIITIMVLDLRPPPQATLSALLPLWPTALSYAVSYLFIAIVWVNHHHLLRFAEHATPRLIWVNFAHLFMVSLVPFSTAWVADTRLAAVPVAVYAAVFVLVNTAYCVFVWETLDQANVEEVSERIRRIRLRRSFLTLGMFVVATLLSLKFPWWGFASVCCVLLVYLRPEGMGFTHEDAGHVETE